MSDPTIQSFFQQDHERLDDLLKRFQELKRSDFVKAKEFFRGFKFGLQRHIVWEEDLLFPAWEQKTGISDGGPTQVMRMEHRQIGEYLEALHKKVQENDPESDQEEQRLSAVLASHNQKEERILYPAIDKLVNDEERASMFQAMRTIPEDRYKVCCGAH